MNENGKKMSVEMQMEKQKKIRRLILILSVLLLLTAGTLGASALCRHLAGNGESTASVPDNEIAATSSSLLDADGTLPAQGGDALSAPDGTPLNNVPAAPLPAVTPVRETTMRLYRGHAQSKDSLTCANMLPGDQETVRYDVNIATRGGVQVYFKAVPEKQNNVNVKLAEVLKVRVTLPQKDKVLYDGLMKNMPNLISPLVSATGLGSSSLQYDVTVYLDTSVGNEYMNQSLSAKLTWWISQSEWQNLESAKTGDTQIVVCVAAAAVSLTALAVLWLTGRKRRCA